VNLYFLGCNRLIFQVCATMVELFLAGFGRTLVIELSCLTGSRVADGMRRTHPGITCFTFWDVFACLSVFQGLRDHYTVSFSLSLRVLS
jgi:hypothetical protein